MSESLRDTISAAVEEHVPETVSEVPAEPVQGVQDAVIPGPGADDPKPGRTAGRPRDEKGRLLPGKPEKPISAAEPGKASPAQTPNAQTVQSAPAAEPTPVVPPIPRPSSWAKEMWGIWDKLNKGVALDAKEARQLAEYNVKREGEFAKGVSTYKTEYDRLKPFSDVIAQHKLLFEQHKIDPAQQFAKYIDIHRGLALGSEQQKLSMLLRIAQDYQIPLNNLFVQGQDGRLYSNPQIQAYQPPPQPAEQPVDVDALVNQRVMQKQIEMTIADFEKDVPTKYPHYEAVKQTMAGLLQAEIATDLADAYQQALRLPRHSDIYEQIQAQEAAEKAKKDAEEKARAVGRARAQAVSPKGSTPTAPSGEKPKGVRAALSEAWDQHVGDGRV